MTSREAGHGRRGRARNEIVEMSGKSDQFCTPGDLGVGVGEGGELRRTEEGIGCREGSIRTVDEGGREGGRNVGKKSRASPLNCLDFFSLLLVGCLRVCLVSFFF